jgi:hypothetical protein
MPKYKVNVCRTAYANLDIEVEAPNQKAAEEKALIEAGDHLFSENRSEYTAEGITQL